jgi:membrane-associated phospholipid phosphatase
MHFFIICSIICWLVSFFIYFTFGDIEVSLFINGMNNSSLDLFYAAMSYLGTGLSITVFFIVLLSQKKYRTKNLWLGILVYSIATPLITFGLKSYFNLERPLSILKGSLHKVSFIDNAYHYSFPSGHTLTAFSFASYFIYAFKIQSKSIQLGLFLYAFLVGYSRIYLAQHFISDVLFGSALGIILGSTIGVLLPIRENNQSFV